MVFHRVQVSASTDQLLTRIHRFIYNNEQFCGNPFNDPTWLPAHEKCEMECDLLTEICQESTRKAAIKAQRCQKCKFLRNGFYNLRNSLKVTRDFSILHFDII